MHFKMLSANCQPLCPGAGVLTQTVTRIYIYIYTHAYMQAIAHCYVNLNRIPSHDWSTLHRELYPTIFFIYNTLNALGTY